MAAAGMKMPAVLFCYTHNRCRSRMAEAVARHLLPGWTFMSAGSAPAGGIDPGAEAALRESGLEASGPARRVQDLDLSAFDLIVTLCAQEESYLWLPPALSRRVLHVPFEDPSRLGADTPQSVRNEAFRHLMIELGAFCLTLPDTLEKIHAAEDMRRS